MRVPDGSGEPVVADWAEVEVSTLLDHLGVLDRGRPAVLAVNGRSGAGKTTLSKRLVAAVPDAVLVSTDDVAWHFSMFDWADELRTRVVEPVRRGEAVRGYRPPGWVTKGRLGSLDVEADRSLLVIEGVGSGQRGMVEALDAAIWVQSDADEAERLGIARDIASGVNGDVEQSVAFWHQWIASENAFLAEDAPWSRADAIVAGVPLVIGDAVFWQASDPR